MFTFSAADTFTYTKGNAVGPFDASLQLALTSISDSDGVGVKPTTLPLTWSPTGTNQIRYGYLQMHNANGPMDKSLPIKMEAMYWTNGAYQKNSDDNCTPLADTRLTLTPATGTTATGAATLVQRGIECDSLVCAESGGGVRAVV